MAFEKYDLTVKPYGVKKVNVQQELPSGRRIPYMKPTPFKSGGKISYPLVGQVKPAWMRNR
jgi:hypothetical protein|tara:strand:- start:728 stop:910 length:183 start_codon:yes stop_codon:yes gene_type:complete